MPIAENRRKYIHNGIVCVYTVSVEHLQYARYCSKHFKATFNANNKCIKKIHIVLYPYSEHFSSNNLSKYDLS